MLGSLLRSVGFLALVCLPAAAQFDAPLISRITNLTRDDTRLAPGALMLPEGRDSSGKGAQAELPWPCP